MVDTLKSVKKRDSECNKDVFTSVIIEKEGPDLS